MSKNHLSKEYRHIREVVLWLHDYTCYFCQEKIESLETHHLTKNSDTHSIFGIVPTCGKCHKLVGKMPAKEELDIQVVIDLICGRYAYYEMEYSEPFDEDSLDY